MNVTFFDRQEEDNPLNGSRLFGGEETLNLLERLKFRDPFMCELVGENGYTLLMGLGGSVASVQYSRNDGEPPYLEAVAPGKPKQILGRDGHHYQAAVEEDRNSGATAPEFMMGGTPTPIPTRYVLPYAREGGGNLFRGNWTARSRHCVGGNIGKFPDDWRKILITHHGSASESLQGLDYEGHVGFMKRS